MFDRNSSTRLFIGCDAAMKFNLIGKLFLERSVTTFYLMARTGRPKGQPKTGGRKKGTPNRPMAWVAAEQAEKRERQRVSQQQARERRVREVELVIAMELPRTKLEDMDPLSIIHAIMLIRWKAGDLAGALLAAIALAPYTNARLSSSEVRVTHDLAALSDEELRQQALAYEQKIAALTPVIDGEIVH
jgi:hypothetical protein